MKKDEIINMQVKKRKSGYLQQDFGMLIFLSCLFIGIVFVVNAPSELRLEFLGMLLATFLGIVFAAYRFIVTAAVCAGLQITFFTAFKLFFYYANGSSIQLMEYVWLFYPLLAVGAMSLFINRSIKLERQNEILMEQIDTLVLVDPLTGLYNLKCLYLDLEGQTALASRRGTEITLMIMAFRYEVDLKKILGRKNFDILKQKVAILVQDSLRVEDKLYAIDEKGSLAVILTCNSEGAEVVKRRIKHALTQNEGVPEIVRDRVIKLDLQFAYLQYDAEKYGRDVMGYKRRVESELQYDV